MQLPVSPLQQCVPQLSAGFWAETKVLAGEGPKLLHALNESLPYNHNQRSSMSFTGFENLRREACRGWGGGGDRPGDLMAPGRCIVTCANCHAHWRLYIYSRAEPVTGLAMWLRMASKLVLITVLQPAWFYRIEAQFIRRCTACWPWEI